MDSAQTSGRPLELWAGPECTVRRAGDAYLDQLELTGHDRRLADLDRFAALGIRAIRYPVLWERTAPIDPAQLDWRFADERLARLRELGIRPILGLVHHGSGPRYTSLADPAFPTGLARFARAVAERFPWVEDWTPVNEPLTTARFSGLYGHWYPHGRDDVAFVRTLLTQVRGVAEAMAAIRAVVPGARLVQTDDLGKVFSTTALAYQAEFENDRRWLTWDLLCGRVDRNHPLWPWLTSYGRASAGELEWFLEHPCPPDVVGVNHYLSSERFLDDRTDAYPDGVPGGNTRHEYVDVLAARVAAEGPAGPEELLRETWGRYGLPVAVTECHNGCTREEQIRWLVEVWQAAEAVRAAGADVRAVTLWSLLGAVGWDTMLTDSDTYEPGVFDVRSDPPRATALAALAGELAATGRGSHPVLATPGWWRRADRLFYEPVSTGARSGPYRAAGPERPLLVIGARGTLGRAFARICEARGLAYELVARERLDAADPVSAHRALAEIRPWAVVNAAGYVRVDDAELDAARCRRENADGPAALAEACERYGARLATFSSDLVFDGRAARPYVEGDPVGPLGVYGETKAEAERRVLAVLADALVVRASAFFGPWDEYNFVTIALRELRTGGTFAAIDDVVVSPTYVPSLVHATLDLLIDAESGVWHLANPGAVTWADLARRAAELDGLPADWVEGVPVATLALPAVRPRYSALGSERAVLLPPLEEDLARFFAEREDAVAATV